MPQRLARSAPRRVFAKCFMKVCLWACYKFTSQVVAEGAHSASALWRVLRAQSAQSKVDCEKFPRRRRALLLLPEIRINLRQSRDVLCDHSCSISYFLLVFGSNYTTGGVGSGGFQAPRLSDVGCEADTSSFSSSARFHRKLTSVSLLS